MRIGFTSVTFRNLSQEEVCKIAKENNVKFIEWGTDVHVQDSEVAKKVKALCDEYDIKTITVGSYYRVGDNDLGAFEKDCVSASILGAERIRVWLGRIASVDTNEDTYLEYVSEIQKLADIAKKYSLDLCFEYHKKTYNDTFKSSNKIIRDVNKDNVKTLWQPFSYDNDMESLLGILDNLKEVHVFAWDINYQRYPLSWKKEDWKAFIDVFKPYNPDLIMEFVKDDNTDNFKEDLNLLRSII